MSVHVRELPPLRQSFRVTAPSGRRYRWSEDEPDGANVPSGGRHSSSMPGGFDSLDLTLPRKPGVDYSGMDRLATIELLSASGNVDGEYRLERAPSVSGDQMAISPSAAGWQNHLEDNKSVRTIIIDRALTAWRGASVTRRAGLGASWTLTDPSVDADASSIPALRLAVEGKWASPAKPISEAFYDAGGDLVGGILYTPAYGPSVNTADANWSLGAYVQDGDGTGTLTTEGDVFPSTSHHLWSPTTARRYAALQWFYNATPGGVDGAEFSAWIKNLAVIGDHGLTLQGPAGAEGFLGSDIVSYAVRMWAPLLNVTPESVPGSSLVITHLPFLDPTTVGEIVRQTTRFELQDWAVWENKTFWWYPRGAYGRKWRARIGPAGLEETGPQVDRVWESVLVQFQDVDGSTRTVGPPGSGADAEDSALKDSDPENPANRLGITRRDLLVIGVATVATATEVGRRFLEQTKLLDSSGRARFVGYVEDDRGVLHPYSAVRAGDQVAFIDAVDTSYRRIVKADHTRADRSCVVDLDAPPEGLAAVLEQLNAALVPLGL